ncbi:MAG: hypothetical protein FIB01_06120 [Gemmatimonadetes bacterium]|nr:hypothetical protein [Gemmatimonadota bacterium]
MPGRIRIGAHEVLQLAGGGIPPGRGDDHELGGGREPGRDGRGRGGRPRRTCRGPGGRGEQQRQFAGHGPNLPVVHAAGNHHSRVTEAAISHWAQK